MRTTLDLPEELLNEAMSLTGEKTKTAVIIRALKTEIKKAKMVEVLNLRGKYPDMEIDLDVLRGRDRAKRHEDLMKGITDDFDSDWDHKRGDRTDQDSDSECPPDQPNE